MQFGDRRIDEHIDYMCQKIDSTHFHGQHRSMAGIITLGNKDKKMIEFIPLVDDLRHK